MRIRILIKNKDSYQEINLESFYAKIFPPTVTESESVEEPEVSIAEAPTSIPTSTPTPVPTPTSIQMAVPDQLCQGGGQRIPLNPEAGLLKLMMQNNRLPNSVEVIEVIGGVTYAAQRAENIQTGEVLLYFTAYNGIVATSIQELSQPFQQQLYASVQSQQLIEFDPNAAFLKAIVADEFIPNSKEFDAMDQGIKYRAQHAENSLTRTVKVYYVAVGDWDNVQEITCS